MWQPLPEILGQERHHGVEQPENRVQDVQQNGPGPGRLLGGRARQQAWLGHFEIPVAVFVPEKLVQGIGGFVEAKFAQPLVHGRRKPLETAQDPAVLEPEGGTRRKRRPGPRLRLVTEIEQDEARRVPDLVGERTVADHALLGQGQVAARRRHGRQGEAQCVRAIPFNQIEGVDDVAACLRHLLALGVPHQAGDVDLAERNLLHEVQAQHHHPAHPEEQDVETGDQDRGRVIAPQLGGRVRPAEGGERPEPRREPGVQDIRILPERRAAAASADRGRRARHVDLRAAGAVPGRDLVSPPQLP